MKRGAPNRKRTRNDRTQATLSFRRPAAKLTKTKEATGPPGCIICGDKGTFEFTAKTHSAWREFLQLTASDSASQALLLKVAQSSTYACPKCSAPNEVAVKLEAADGPTPVVVPLTVSGEQKAVFSEWLFSRLVHSGVDPHTAMELAQGPRLDVTSCLIEADSRVCQTAEQATLNFVQNMSREAFEEQEMSRRTRDRLAFLQGEYNAAELDAHGLLSLSSVSILLDWPTFDEANDALVKALRAQLHEWLLLQQRAMKWYGPAAASYTREVTERLKRLSDTLRCAEPYTPVGHFNRLTEVLARETQRLSEGLAAVDFDNQLALPPILRAYAPPDTDSEVMIHVDSSTNSDRTIYAVDE